MEGWQGRDPVRAMALPAAMRQEGEGDARGVAGNQLKRARAVLEAVTASDDEADGGGVGDGVGADAATTEQG